MARGDCEKAFAESAAADGIVLNSQSLPWITRRGHLALTDEACAHARDALQAIFLALGGDTNELELSAAVRLTGDFLHGPTGTMIEVDEHQHFTSARLQTLRLYPPGHPGRVRSRALRGALPSTPGTGEPCFRPQIRASVWARRTTASARVFRLPARSQRSRHGAPPVIRIDAPHGNGGAAYRQHRARLLELLGP